MTLEEARNLYIGAGGPDDHQPSEWESIHHEIEAIVSAKSDQSAGKTILWWGCWDGKFTATKFARKVRKLHTVNYGNSKGVIMSSSNTTPCVKKDDRGD